MEFQKTIGLKPMANNNFSFISQLIEEFEQEPDDNENRNLFDDLLSWKMGE